LCQNPKVHQHVRRSLPPVPTLSQVNPLCTFPANLPKIHSNPILLYMSQSVELFLSFGLSLQNYLHFSVLSHACHMPCHLIALDLMCLTISGDEYKLRSSPLYNFLCSLVTSSCTVQVFSSAPCSQTPSSLNGRDQVSHPYRTTGRIMVFIF
jgi:hypothetical protein